MGQRVYQIDAFTAEPFAGNPAAICILDSPREDSWMQAVAAEMNLAETAYLERREGGWGLRWFTPRVEVDLCGHATLASAHLLWELGLLEPTDTAVFETRSGRLEARRRGERIELRFPALPPLPVAGPPGLAAALGAQPQWVGQGKIDLIVELDSEETVRRLDPDIRALAELGRRGAGQGVIVTAAASTAGLDFVSRYFAPNAGIDEDPVTGAAHCCLTPYWTAKLGQKPLQAFQASARGGGIEVELDGDRVLLRGYAVTVLRAELSDGL